MKHFLLSVGLLGSLTVGAQTLNRYAPAGHVLVEKGSNVLSAPFSGGINVPQFAQADLNQDGKNDLVVFEGYGLRGVKTFINHGFAGAPEYRYEPAYATVFPEINNYLILKDYNGDGIADLFHNGFGGINVSKGYYSGGKLHFQFVKELIYIYSDPGQPLDSVNVYVAGGMIPGIADVDNDGDLDFLTFSILGSRVLMFKNVQRELQMPNDSIRLSFETGCWGRTFQDYQRTAVMGLDPNSQACTLRYIWNPGQNPSSQTSSPSPGALAKTAMHGGNTIAMVDIDGDGDQDYLNGNESFNDIQLLINGRSQYGVDSIIAQDTLWQRNGIRYQVGKYPAAFFIDYDNDGNKDIVIAPHGSGSKNNNQVWWYQNTGSASAPQFTFRNDSLFSSQTIDAGRLSCPLFYDFTKDGKPDLLVGGLEKLATGVEVSRLHLYENITTTPGNPRFRYVTNDLVGLAGISVYATDPAVGDVDGDGLDDLVMGRLDGKLIYFRNYAASAAVAPVWRLEEREMTRGGGVKISVPANASPALYDLNQDGKPDLVLGQLDGTLTTFTNTNTISGLASFGTPVANFGNVRVPDRNPDTSAANPFRFSRPFLGKLQAGSTKEYLLMGGGYGLLYAWDNIGAATMPLLADSFSQIQTADYSAPAVADIDGDGKLEMVVGNELGGLTLYWTGIGLSVPELAATEGHIAVYPNPVQNQMTLSRKGQWAQTDAAVRITDLTGRVIHTENWLSGNTTLKIETHTWSAGIYLVSVTGSSGRETYKVQVVR
ncbi:MAG: T9SS type A sorting domain-containing protein [Sphingobacteriales bacterium]|nr:MAG: T9SS type A sorting domain-containing protein [Sphingobacteriales bacterium]